jgi:maleylacetoacetate isomerase
MRILIPQLYAAERFNVPLEGYPRIPACRGIGSHNTPPSSQAHPSNQPDTPDTP